MKKVTCHDINGEEQEVEKDQLIYRPSIYGILIEDGKVLLSKQYDGYDFPGGGQELDETVHQTLQREFFEETGLQVEVLDVMYGGTSFFHPTHSKKYEHQFWNCPLLYFTVKRTGGALSTEYFDEAEKTYANLAEWIPLSNIDDLKFINSVDSVAIIKKAAKFL